MGLEQECHQGDHLPFAPDSAEKMLTGIGLGNPDFDVAIIDTRLLIDTSDKDTRSNDASSGRSIRG